MATLSQIEANRLNSQKSTGPRTPEGKAVSSQNAFKSGLDADSQFCYGEERADFYRLQVEYFTRFSPQSPEERFHVDTLLRNEWSLRRLFPPRRRPPRRRLQHFQPRLHATAPPHHPLREILRGIPHQDPDTPGSPPRLRLATRPSHRRGTHLPRPHHLHVWPRSHATPYSRNSRRSTRFPRNWLRS